MPTVTESECGFSRGGKAIDQLKDLSSSFARDGYAVVSECLSEKSCIEIGEQFADGCYGLRELLTLAPIRELACSPEVLDLARAVLGNHVFAVSGTFFNKTAAANWKVPWHQDRMVKVKARLDANDWGPWSNKDGVIHVQPPPLVMSRVLAIRLHLDDCPAENGALRVIPGSHRHGFLNPEQTAVCLAELQSVCPVPRGGAFLMSPLLLHTSSPSTSPRSRRVIHLEFAAEDLPAPLEWLYRVA